MKQSIIYNDTIFKEWNAIALLPSLGAESFFIQTMKLFFGGE